MDLQRYDIVKVKIQYDNGSTQHGVRPYVIISNPLGTKFGTIITVMPLTSKIKRTEMPVHSCIKANENNGLREQSMALGEQIFTISKNEVIKKLGNITDKKQRYLIDKACFNGLFYGTDYKLEEGTACI